jgi:putative transposase
MTTPSPHNRRSLRMQEYDYSWHGIYFITLCAFDRKCGFGNIVNFEMRPSAVGEIIIEEWLKSETIREEIELETWALMPNHFHGIVVIKDTSSLKASPTDVIPTTHPLSPAHLLLSVGAHGRAPGDASAPGDNRAHGRAPLQRKSRSLSSFMAGFKSATTKRINIMLGTPGAPVWQRNYYEHVIRNGREFSLINYYILNNPVNWVYDKENPVAKSMAAGARRCDNTPGASENVSDLASENAFTNTSENVSESASKSETVGAHGRAPFREISDIFGGELP